TAAQRSTARPGGASSSRALVTRPTRCTPTRCTPAENWRTRATRPRMTRMAVLRRIVALWTQHGPARSTDGGPWRAAVPTRGGLVRALGALRQLRPLQALRRLRAPGDTAAIDPTLPATAQIVAVQHPSASLPERPY